MGVLFKPDPVLGPHRGRVASHEFDAGFLRVASFVGLSVT